MDIQKIEEKEQELQKLRKETMAMISQAKAKDGENEVEIKRGGEKIKVTENDLWEERVSPKAPPRAKNEANEILEERHPGIFKKMKKIEKVSDEINQITQEKFGFRFREITPGKLVIVISKIVDEKLAEQNRDQES